MIELREKNHKSQSDMATLLYVNKSTLSRVESGNTSYKNIKEFAEKYCDVLGLTEDQKKLFLRGTKAVVTDTSALLVDEQKETYFKLIEARIRELTRSDASEREYQETKKDIEKIKADIAAQIRNLREADDVLRKFIQDDVTEMSAELSRKEAVLQKLEEERGDNSQTIEDLSQVKKKLADFKESWKTATPEELMSMVRAVVERVYVVYEDDEPIAHIFLKGCIKEDYTSFFDTAGYIPFTGNGVLKVNLCVIQHHENDAEEEIHTQMTQPDKYRELYPHLCGNTASCRM